MPRYRPIEERFWDKVFPEPMSGCWIWAGALSSKGYGRLNGGPGKPPVMAHRLSWLLHFGDPGGLFVCHHCDVRYCVNPDHLFLGTNQDNLDDMKRKGRSARWAGKTHCANGHPLSAENIGIASGERFCRTCRKEYQRRWYVEKRTALGLHPGPPRTKRYAPRSRRPSTPGQ